MEGFEDTCRSCGKGISENYCPNCGEKRFARLKMKDVISDLFDDGVSVERPMFTTLKGMWTKPGKVIAAYIGGDRKRHYRPLKMYLFFLAIYLIFFYVFTSGFEDFYNIEVIDSNIAEESAENNVLLDRIKEVQQYLYQWMVFLQIPILSLLTFLFFRKRGFSFTEHLTGNMYILSQLFLFSMVQSLLTPFNPSAVMFGTFGVCIFYSAWGYRDWFEISWLNALLKSACIFVLGLILFALAIVIISVPVAMLMPNS